MGDRLRKGFAELDDSPRAAIVVDGSGSVVFVNGAANNLYGLSAEGVVGVALADLLRGESGAHPWSDRLLRDHWGAVEVHQTASGVRVWADCVLEELDASHKVLRSERASGRRIVEASSVDLLEALREALTLGDIGVWFDDGRTERLDWSAAARRVFGASPEGEVDHEYFFQKVHPEDRASLGEAIQEVVVGKQTIDLAFRVVDDDGSVRHVRTFGQALFDRDGTSIIGFGGCLDLTASHAKDARIRSLEEQLRQSQKMESVGRLAGGIAHDFNNILTAILGNTEILLRDDLTEMGRSCTEDVRVAVRRAADLTQQLLAFSRKQPMTQQVVNLDEVIEESRRMLARMVGERVTIRFAPGAEGALIYADTSQLQQVVTNLVVNASQAMANGGTVAMGSRCVTIAEDAGRARHGDFVELTVEDSGPGIDSDVLPHIFEPFYTTKADVRGTGLGLSTVHGIVEQHGGFIEVGGTPGQGAAFHIFFPRSRAARADDTEEIDTVATSVAGLRVLLVEDERMIRSITIRLLEEAGVIVTAMEDGLQALEAAKAPFDLLLSDVIMPHMTGPELAARLRADHPELRVLYVSGYPADIVDKRVVLGPRERLLRKPYTRRDLLRAVLASSAAP